MARGPRTARRENMLRRAEDPTSPLPLVAIVGRPNVGKSTLFNRLVGGHNAIVEDEPGVTRDRRYGETEYDGRTFRIVDTGGLEIAPSSRLSHSIQKQAQRAIDEAHAVLFVVDAQEGIVPEDREVISRLRRSGKPILFVANKVDGARHEDSVADVYRLGAEQVFGISAAHGRGMPELLDAIVEGMPRDAVREQADAAVHAKPAARIHVHSPADGQEEEEEEEEEADDDAYAADVGDSKDDEQAAPPAADADHVVRIAFVGRPNAGKSSLINALLQDERMIVDDTPGTTRDPVDTLLTHGGKRYLLIDTAGIRRRARIPEPMEKVAVAMAEKALYRAEVAILVIDGKEGIGEQDARIAGLIQDSGRALLIAFNKRDLMTADDEKRLREDLQRKLQFVEPWALTAVCSAHSGRGVYALLDAARRCYESFSKRVSTGALNRFFDGIVERHPPPLHMGRPIRLYYITQAETCPPTFVLQVNHPEGMHFSYRRYLQNQLRETFGFVGTPVRLIARQRTRQ